VAVLIVVVLLPKSISTGLFIYGVLVAGLGIVGLVKYGMPDYLHMAWWRRALLENGQWFWVALAAAGLVYSALMAVVLLIILGARFLAAVGFMALTSPLVWALGREAHPLRWVAFVIFVAGFQFDLLAS